MPLKPFWKCLETDLFIKLSTETDHSRIFCASNFETSRSWKLNVYPSDNMGRPKQTKMCPSMCKMHKFRFIPRMRKILIRGFCIPLMHFVVSMILLVDSEGPDQTARLICVFAVHICPKTHFRDSYAFLSLTVSAPNFRLHLSSAFFFFFFFNKLSIGKK